MKNKRISVLGVILSIIGVGLIVFGLIVKVRDNESKENISLIGTYSYKKSLDSSKVLYEFEIITNESINTDSVYMIVDKTGVTDSEKFKLTLKSHPANGKGYKYVVSLNSNDYLVLAGDEISLEIKNMSGQKISLSEDFFGSYEKLEQQKLGEVKPFSVFIKAASIMIGIILIASGISIIFIKKKAGEVKSAVVNSLTPDGDKNTSLIGAVVGKVNEHLNKNQNKECSYCGAMNKPDALKCNACGAPIKKTNN